MPILKSSIKDTRRIITRTARNRTIKSRLKTLRQNLSESVENKDKTEIKEAAKNYVSALDKAVKRGIIHRNKASRHKSECSIYSPYLLRGAGALSRIMKRATSINTSLSSEIRLTTNWS